MVMPAPSHGNRGRRIAPVLYRLVLIAGPPFIALVATLTMWSYGFWSQQPRWTADGNPSPSFLEIGWQVLCHFTSKVWNSGPLGISFYMIYYIGSFGIIIVVSMLATRRYRPVRVFAFWSGSVAALLAISVFIWANGSIRSGALSHGIEQYDQYEHWGMYLFNGAGALPLALVVGYIASILPIFRPTRRYWLSRGMCPKCHYDLQHKTDAGCPECGWNRPQNTPSPPASTPSAPFNA